MSRLSEKWLGNKIRTGWKRALDRGLEDVGHDLGAGTVRQLVSGLVSSHDLLCGYRIVDLLD